MVEPLILGICPICDKTIMSKEKSAYINGGVEFWVRFSDNSFAKFAICFDCLDKITQEQLDEIMERQKISWGKEISKSLIWFYQKACHLKITKWAKTKEGLN